MQTTFADNLPQSIIKRLSLKVKAVGGINLGQGIPSFSTPAHIIAAAKTALQEKDIGVYPNFLGNLELRQALTNRLNHEHVLTLNPHTNILITVGAMEATATAILSLINNNDIVGVITPDYCNHFPQIDLARGKRIEIATQKDGSIDFAKIESVAKLGMKLLLFTNPGNPTGYVWQKTELEKLIALAKKYGFWILADETYYFLTYGQKTYSLLDFWQYERLITVRSFSKEYAMTGWRVGYIVAQDAVVELFSRTHDALVGCAPKISQAAALAAIVGSQAEVLHSLQIYKKRRDYVLEKLTPLFPELKQHPPQGAYYLFLNYPQKIASSVLSQQILETVGVGVVPGAAFGACGEGHIRISFAVDDAVLAKGIAKLGDFFEHFTLS